MNGNEALALGGVRYSFGRIQALVDASCRVRRGSIHALLGENGAGKSTLMRIAFGLLTPEAGELAVAGQPVRFRSSAEAILAGIGMVHQHFMLVPGLTAAENVALGGRGRLRLDTVTSELLALAERTGLGVDPSERVSELSIAAQQRLEILRALAHDAKVLILDEPTAVLSPTESASLLAWLRRFVGGGGTAVLITHRLREALAIADDVTVLRRGRTVLAAAVSETAEDEIVSALTGGRDSHTGSRAASTTHPVGAPVLSLTGAGFTDGHGVVRLADATLSVRAGEVLGVLGVEGAGQRELMRLLAGRLAPTSGTVDRPERVGFVPEDRLADALVPEMTLTENVALAEMRSARGRMDWVALTERTGTLLQKADVRSSVPATLAGELSGGNQQRFVVAREQGLDSMALVIEHPTRGLDIRASARVLEELRYAAHELGHAVVIYSPDLDEVLLIATRVVVCFGGRLREVPRPSNPSDRAPYTRALMGMG